MSAKLIANRIDRWMLSIEGENSIKASAWIAIGGYVVGLLSSITGPKPQSVREFIDALVLFANSIATGLTIATWWYWVRLDMSYRKNKRNWFWWFVFLPLLSSFAYTFWRYKPRASEAPHRIAEPLSLRKLSEVIVREPLFWLTAIGIVILEGGAVYFARVEEPTWALSSLAAYFVACNVYLFIRLYRAGMKNSSVDVADSSLGLI